MEQRASKNVKNCLNTNISSYLDTSGGQSSNLYTNVVHFSTSMSIRYPWQLRTIVFMHWCLKHAVLLGVALYLKFVNGSFVNWENVGAPKFSFLFLYVISQGIESVGWKVWNILQSLFLTIKLFIWRHSSRLTIVRSCKTFFQL
jgi:hypothetical protein